MATLAEQIAILKDAQEAAVVEAYLHSDLTTGEILERYSISYNKLYRILRDAQVSLRKPHAHEIVVLDRENGNVPVRVERNTATIKLRDEQVQTAYYVRQEVVTHICKTFHISWRTLYRICPPNRRNFATTTKPFEAGPATRE